MEFNGFRCEHCKKNYKTYKSLWNHTKKYHSNDPSILPQNTSILPQNTSIFECKFCKKNLSRKDNLFRHEKICKENNQNEIVELKQKIETLEQIITKKSGIKKNINKTTNINNIIINNNIQINAVGFENVISKLTDKEKVNLLTGPLFKELPIIELTKMIYSDDKFKDSRNTIITNLQSSTCLAYNKDSHKFDAVNKNKHIENIISSRKEDLMNLFQNMHSKLKNAHVNLLNDYFESLENEDYDKKNNKNHKEEISYIIYNCKNAMKELKEEIEYMDSKLQELKELEDSDENDIIV